VNQFETRNRIVKVRAMLAQVPPAANAVESMAQAMKLAAYTPAEQRVFAAGSKVSEPSPQTWEMLVGAVALRPPTKAPAAANENAPSWFDRQSFAVRSAPQKTTTRYEYVCTCRKCGGSDSGGLPCGDVVVSYDPALRGAINVSCPHGGRWHCSIVMTVPAEQAANEDAAPFGRSA
jgi:hypothetical protein